MRDKLGGGYAASPGLIALVALGLDASRRRYALDLSDRFIDLAAVLMGGSPIVRPRHVEGFTLLSPTQR